MADPIEGPAAGQASTRTDSMTSAHVAVAETAAPFKIAHLSDLHFGAKGQVGVWEALARFLIDELRPRLLLVTGDIVDSPRESTYQTARGRLDSLSDALRCKYYVCPGNHDRHWLGNRLLGIKSKTAAVFDREFRDHLTSLGNPAYESLDVGSAQWRLRIAGLDSCETTDAWARGFVKWTDLQELARNVWSEEELDLAVLLLHHHPFPVRRLEADRQGSRSDLFNLTALVNAGSLLESCAQGHVDLVLHGHEHAINWGRYATLEGGGGQTTVIGAGSATGMETRSGCSVSRASFNVLELWPRAVRVTVFQHEAERWEPRPEPIELFDAQDLRRARFLRRSSRVLRTPPRSEIVKRVEFTRAGDGLVYESRTNWIVENRRWTHTARNSTGVPTDLRVGFRSTTGAVFEVPEARFARSSTEDHTWHFQCEVPEYVAAQPQHIDLQYRWFGGAILTQQELNALDRSSAGPYRRNGYEFAAITCVGLPASLQLLVMLPPEFAPPREADVKVFVEDGSEARFEELPQPSAEFTDRLCFLGRGTYSLTVPFPRGNYRYVIGWQPPTLEGGPGASEFAQIARARGDELAGAVAEGFRGTFGDALTVALYVPVDKWSRGGQLRRVGWFHPGPPEQRLVATPELVLIRGGDSSLVAQAWRGGVVVLPPGDVTDAELGEGEQAAIALPVRFGLDWILGSPWAVVRLGLRQLSSQARDLLLPSSGSRLRLTLYVVMLRAMGRFVEMRD